MREIADTSASHAVKANEDLANCWTQQKETLQDTIEELRERNHMLELENVAEVIPSLTRAFVFLVPMRLKNAE